MFRKILLLVIISIILLFTGANVFAGAVLKITKTEIIPDFPQPGSYVKASFTVKNIGDQAVPGLSSLAVEIYSSNKKGNRVSGDFIKAIPWYTKNINPLPPNASQVISTVVILHKEGYHMASAVLISEGYTLEQLRVVEGENNKLFYVGRPADLVLENVSLNHQGRLILRMFNAGAYIPDEHFQAALISVKAVGNTYQIPLSKAAPGTLQLAGKDGIMGIPIRHKYIWKSSGEAGFTLSPNLQHKVEVYLDYNQKILDNKRFNNTKTVWVGGKPDLVVCFKKFNHNKPNRNAYYPPIVKNIGFARSSPAKLRFWIMDDGVKTYSIPALNPGEEYKGVQRRVYWIRVKNHRFRLTADFNNDVDELAEDNNIIEGTIIVGKYGVNSPIKCSDEAGMTGWK